jgi:gamma-glutamyltranspeptidase/glutathione hydrolase
MNKFSIATILFSFIILIGCKTENSATDKAEAQRGLTAEKAMVVSARKEASEIGIEILKQGGNAFDAMMATEMALALTYPVAGNLGGGGFMVYRLNDGQKGSLDFREKAPVKATKDMYLDENGNIIAYKSRHGVFGVGVPGTIAGIFEAQEKFGLLEPDAILKPVIELAQKGYVVTDKQAKRLQTFDSLLLMVNGKQTLYHKGIKAGDTIRNLALANTLSRIAKHGKDEFYKGETAKSLVDFMTQRGGLLQLEDLSKYEAVWRDPITFNYDDMTITSMGPPSSGGICLHQIFNMLAAYDLKELGQHSTDYIHLIAEAERRAYADRSYYLGDPDFVEIPIDTLVSTTYAKTRMQSFTFDSATASTELSYGKIPGFESEETTHYSIVDQFGNAVAVTTTINAAYGSKLYVEDLGFFLNNEMDDFSSKPGAPNFYGLVGAEANSIAPEKRMLSSMTPSIVEKDEQLYMVVGTPGGSTIITSVLQTILNVSQFGMTMQQAVDTPRFHHQWLPDEIRMEPHGFSQETKAELEALGHKINESRSPIIGKVDAILVLDNGQLEAGADKRGDDTAVGF